MIRRMRWWRDLLVSRFTPIHEDCVACCGCGRYRVSHCLLSSGETYCDNCLRLPLGSRGLVPVRSDLPHYSFGGEPLVRWTWKDVGSLLHLREVQITAGWPEG